jgi:hypothetical protein
VTRTYMHCGEPTSGLEPLTCSLRVIGHPLQGLAQGCKSRISRGASFLRIALCCTVLRSRWCQSGINIALISAQHAYPRVVLFNLDTSALTHATDRWDQSPYRHSRHGTEKGPSNLVSLASWPTALEHRSVGPDTRLRPSASHPRARSLMVTDSVLKDDHAGTLYSSATSSGILVCRMRPLRWISTCLSGPVPELPNLCGTPAGQQTPGQNSI